MKAVEKTTLSVSLEVGLRNTFLRYSIGEGCYTRSAPSPGTGRSAEDE